MEASEKIIRKLRELAAKEGPPVTLLGKVVAVDEATGVCDIFDDDSQITFKDVRLNPIRGNYGYIIVPKINSWAMAVRVEDSEDWMLIHANQIKSIKINAEEVVFNGGTKGGLINIETLKSELNKTNEVVNTIVNALKNWTVVPSDGGAALKTYFGTQIVEKQVGDFTAMVDDKVKH